MDNTLKAPWDKFSDHDIELILADFEQLQADFKAAVQAQRTRVPAVQPLTTATAAELAKITKRDDDIDAVAPASG
jgi:hypothetical protein